MKKENVFSVFSVIRLGILLALVITLTFPAMPARAATFTVDTEAELTSAINSANGNSEADTIILAADITLTSALPQITSEITIEGRGFTLDGNNSCRVLDITSAGNLTINNVTIANGSVTGGGGGIYNLGTLVVNHCTFSGNSAGGGPNGRGGGIYNDGTLTVNDSTFTGNTADNAGGGIYNHNNSAASSINNSTFSGNSARYGGGLLNNATGSTLTVNNSTFTANSAGRNGGGIRNNQTLTLNRNIVSGNTALTASEVYSNTNAITSANNYNVFAHSGLTDAQAFSGFTPGANDYNASSDGNNIALGSILDTILADNGGPTKTHALVSGSPAIDRAPTADCSGTDQRGAARNYDGDGSSSSNECDSGAYEVRESITQGTCGTGSLLSGEQAFAFSSNITVTINVSTTTDLRCITVEEMGADHLAATTDPDSDEALETGNWWHITGDGSDFSVSITLPYSNADDNSRVCKYPGSSGGYGWDCNPNNTTYIANTSVTRSGITGFSDWAVGDHVGPTTITIANFKVQSAIPMTSTLLTVALVLAGGLITLRLRRKSAH